MSEPTRTAAREPVRGGERDLEVVDLGVEEVLRIAGLEPYAPAMAPRMSEEELLRAYGAHVLSESELLAVYGVWLPGATDDEALTE